MFDYSSSINSSALFSWNGLKNYERANRNVGYIFVNNYERNPGLSPKGGKEEIPGEKRFSNPSMEPYRCGAKPQRGKAHIFLSAGLILHKTLRGLVNWFSKERFVLEELGVVSVGKGILRFSKLNL